MTPSPLPIRTFLKNIGKELTISARLTRKSPIYIPENNPNDTLPTIPKGMCIPSIHIALPSIAPHVTISS